MKHKSFLNFLLRLVISIVIMIFALVYLVLPDFLPFNPIDDIGVLIGAGGLVYKLFKDW